MNILRITLVSLLLSTFLTTDAFASRSTTTQAVRILNSESVIPNSGMLQPRTVRFTPPRYTQEARAKHVEGTVTVMAAIDIDGNATPMQVVKGLGYGLDENALAAVQQWRFEPAYQNGLRVGVIANVDVVFNLNGDIRSLLMQAILAKLESRKKP